MDHSHHDHGAMDMNTTTMMMMGNSTMDHQHHHGTTEDPHAGHEHGGGGGGMEHGDMDHDMDHSMRMYFHAGLMEYILFEPLRTKDVGGLVGACIVIFLLSVLYEALKYFREYLLRCFSRPSRDETYTPSTAPNGDVVTKQPEVGAQMLSGSHALQTLLHMVQVFISYCLMLIFMTYNVYLCIAIILGAGVGYFLFGWRRANVVDMNEHCH